MRLESSRILPGQGYADERFERLALERKPRTTTRGRQRHEIVDEDREVFDAGAERRHLDGEHVETVEKVAAEVAAHDGFFEVAMRGGDDAHVALARDVAADALIDALLQDAQQLHLHRQTHVADLVEEQRAALGDFESSLAGGDGAGEGALLVTEQFALEELGGNGAAVDGDEGTLTARTRGVNGARGDLFTSTGFP